MRYSTTHLTVFIFTTVFGLFGCASQSPTPPPNVGKVNLHQVQDQVRTALETRDAKALFALVSQPEQTAGLTEDILKKFLDGPFRDRLGTFTLRPRGKPFTDEPAKLAWEDIWASQSGRLLASDFELNQTPEGPKFVKLMEPLVTMYFTSFAPVKTGFTPFNITRKIWAKQSKPPQINPLVKIGIKGIYSGDPSRAVFTEWASFSGSFGATP